MEGTNFSSILKSYRLGQKLKQAEVASKVGVSQQCVSEWEKGKTEPTLTYLWRLADLFDVTIDDLVGRKKF